MTGLRFGKGKLRCEEKREKRLTQAEFEAAARRMVRARDGRRCSVPGCREDGVQLHHIIYRSQSKRQRWLPSNLIYLCVAHHKLEHAGKITISGTAEDLTVNGEAKYLKFRL